MDTAMDANDNNQSTLWLHTSSSVGNAANSTCPSVALQQSDDDQHVAFAQMAAGSSTCNRQSHCARTDAVGGGEWPSDGVSACSERLRERLGGDESSST